MQRINEPGGAGSAPPGAAARRGGNHDEVAREIARLLICDRQACLEAWHGAFGISAPKHLSVQFMRKALAYEFQAKTFGGLPNRVRRQLLTVAAGGNTGRSSAQMHPGARLIREWNGRTHEVEVLAEGFLWKGKRFRSLSAVAREITGARWSGPRFFAVGG
jgi:hypothetical protein